MKNDKTNSRQNKALRRSAKKKLADNKGIDKKLSSAVARKLVHELQVHHVELEMQNEELRRAQQELEASRNKYIDLYNDLYDFAPVGCFTLDEKETILKANLTGAALLGVERSRLLNTPFSYHVSENSRDIFYSHWQQIFSGTERQHCEITLNKKDGAQWYAQLESMPMVEGELTNRYCRTVVHDITDLKQSEKQSRDARDFIEKIIRTMPDGIMVTDNKGYIIRVNKAVEVMLGYTGEELTGRHPLEFSRVNDTSAKTGGDMIIGLRKQGFLNNFQAEWQRKDGTVIPVELNVTLLKNNDGVPTGSVSVIRDITLRKQAEEELKESEDKYRNLVERANDGIIIAQDKIVKFANQRMAELDGSSIEQIVGTPFSDHVYPTERPKLAENYRKRMAGEKIPAIYETVLQRSDGSPAPAELNAGVILYQGRPADLIMVRDITQRKQAEKALRESVDRFHSVTEQANDSIFITDLSGTIKFWNRQSEKLYGYTADEVQGKKYSMLIPDRDRDKHEKWQQRFFAGKITKKAAIDEGTIRCKDGTELQVESSVTCFTQNETKFFVCINRDITERKRAEEALQWSEAFNRTVLDSLASHIVVLDARGIIVSTNEPWRRFARENGLPDLLKAAEGDSYLSVCRAAMKAGVDDAATHLKGIKDVLSGKRAVFTAEYPCDSPTEKRWFLMRVTRRNDKDGGVVISHQNITGQKRAEEAAEKNLMQVRALAARLETIREEEQTRIARIVHDDLGQALTGLKFDVTSIENKISANDGKLPRTFIVKKVQSMNALITEIVPIVNRIVSQTRPAMLDDLGLNAAIEWQMRKYEEWTGKRFLFSSTLKDKNLDRKLATALFRIVQEALNNVVRHAHATVVKITLQHKNNSLIVKVSDNGRGINEKKINDFRSFGLTGMRERAIGAGGVMQISRRPGKGTTVMVSVPFKKQKSLAKAQSKDELTKTKKISRKGAKQN
jgi:PAS domain S-box-containing protein